MERYLQISPEYNDLSYIYRIADVNLDKVTLEKYKVKLERTLDKIYSAKITDEDMVGRIVQKVEAESLIFASYNVDEFILDFAMNPSGKTIIKIISLFESKNMVKEVTK